MNSPTTSQQYEYCVVVHSCDDAMAALRPGLPVVLLSAPGTALSAGALWWRGIVNIACDARPNTPCDDILDCADAPGLAMSALRVGQRRLILWATCPAFGPVFDAAAAMGARVDAHRPPALDLGVNGAIRHLPAWLQGNKFPAVIWPGAPAGS